MNRQIYRALRMNKLRLLKKIFSWEEIYAVGIRKRNGEHTLLDDVSSPFTIIPTDDGCWYADPLIYEFDGRTWLFVESFNRKTGKGSIAAAEVDNSGTYTFRTVINEPYHLSFPMIFHWKGEIWMCPESSANMSLNLYRCVSMPDQWEKVCEIRTEVPLVDTVVLKNDGDSLQLLSSTFRPDNGLYVKYILSTLTDDYRLMVQENDGAFSLTERNAGIPFRAGGAEYLPAQQSTDVDYGVFLNIVPLGSKGASVRLSAEDLSFEGPAGNDRIGIHTYSLTGRYEAVDLRYLKFMPDKYLNKIKRS